MNNISILGATGSIGLQTLAVIRDHARDYQVFALSAHTQADRMLTLCLEHKPRFAVMTDPQAARDLQQALSAQQSPTHVLSGRQALIDVVTNDEVDTVMAAIVGSPGLASTLAAVRAGKKVLLANKEALVMGGALFMQAVKTHKACLLPIDSEHNAVFQCLPTQQLDVLPDKGIKKIWLTASGGPFLKQSLDALKHVTPAQACAHPNWSMGQKISVDSATMMNKALEIIEAHWLFAMPEPSLEVVIHPQSILHALVEYQDGSFIGHMGYPDMRTPIAHALAWPARIPSGAPALDLFTQGGQLDFSPPDAQRFPVLTLARQALRSGQSAAILFNAANEVAVAAFLQEKIAFTAIADVIKAVLNMVALTPVNDLDMILAADAQARRQAEQCVATADNMSVLL